MLEIRRLSVAEAHVLIEGSVAASREINVPMCIAVVDESGNLIAFERMDGGKISSISIAVDEFVFYVPFATFLNRCCCMPASSGRYRALAPASPSR